VSDIDTSMVRQVNLYSRGKVTCKVAGRGGQGKAQVRADANETLSSLTASAICTLASKRSATALVNPTSSQSSVVMSGRTLFLKRLMSLFVVTAGLIGLVFFGRNV